MSATTLESGAMPGKHKYHKPARVVAPPLEENVAPPVSPVFQEPISAKTNQAAIVSAPSFTAAMWTCPACTLHNDDNATSCQVCDTPRPENSSAWYCITCTYLNQIGGTEACAICQEPRFFASNDSNMAEPSDPPQDTTKEVAESKPETDEALKKYPKQRIAAKKMRRRQKSAKQVAQSLKTELSDGASNTNAPEVQADGVEEGVAKEQIGIMEGLTKRDGGDQTATKTQSSTNVDVSVKDGGVPNVAEAQGADPSEREKDQETLAEYRKQRNAAKKARREKGRLAKMQNKSEQHETTPRQNDAPTNATSNTAEHVYAEEMKDDIHDPEVESETDDLETSNNAVESVSKESKGSKNSKRTRRFEARMRALKAERKRRAAFWQSEIDDHLRTVDLIILLCATEKARLNQVNREELLEPRNQE